MQAGNRIIVNTLAQYTRTIINVLLSLYSARLVLLILGQSDFGLYALIAGAVALLSFLTNSLVASTQRFLNIKQGEGKIEKVKEVFSNSLVIHILLGIVVAIILELLTPLFFNGFLNIPTGRTDVAITLYHLTIIMVFLSLIISPFRALLISRENIVYISIIDVTDGALKLGLVLLLPYISIDHLVMYSWMMLSIQLFNLLAFSIYDFIKYEECVIPNFKLLNKEYFLQLSSFTGWVLYSSFCITMRNQGFAIVINKALGTVANAAYGIGNTIAGYVSFVSSSFNTAIAPQLMKSEGAKDHDRMLKLAEIQGRISYLLLGFISIPLCFVMYPVLKFWLKDVPDNAEIYSIMVLIGILVDQPTTGLAASIQAVGKMRFYTLMAYTPKFLILPVSWFVLKCGGTPTIVAIIYIGIEASIMLLRIWLARRVVAFNVNKFIESIFSPILWPTTVCVSICIMLRLTIGDNGFWSTALILIIGFTSFSSIAYLKSLTQYERQKIKDIIVKVKSKVK